MITETETMSEIINTVDCDDLLASLVATHNLPTQLALTKIWVKNNVRDYVKFTGIDADKVEWQTVVADCLYFAE